jgi:hypothetical protein
MLRTIDLPLVSLAILFAGFAALDWRRVPLAGRICLGVATTFALAAYQHPGMSVNDLIAHTQTGMTYLVALARVLGAVTVLASVTMTVRGLTSR